MLCLPIFFPLLLLLLVAGWIWLSFYRKTYIQSEKCFLLCQIDSCIVVVGGGQPKHFILKRFSKTVPIGIFFFKMILIWFKSIYEHLRQCVKCCMYVDFVLKRKRSLSHIIKILDLLLGSIYTGAAIYLFFLIVNNFILLILVCFLLCFWFVEFWSTKRSNFALLLHFIRICIHKLCNTPLAKQYTYYDSWKIYYYLL